MERTGFSEEEVRAVLEPEGLWARVLGFDPALLKQLLADEAVPGHVRDKLEELKRVTATFPQLWVKRHSGEEE
jgi:hypothetical protein